MLMDVDCDLCRAGHYKLLLPFLALFTVTTQSASVMTSYWYASLGLGAFVLVRLTALLTRLQACVLGGKEMGVLCWILHGYLRRCVLIPSLPFPASFRCSAFPTRDVPYQASASRKPSRISSWAARSPSLCSLRLSRSTSRLSVGYSRRPCPSSSE